MSEEAKKTPKTNKYKVKDEFFNKEKSILSKDGKSVKVVPVDIRNLSLNGTKHMFKKGQALTPEQLKDFDSEAKKYWLTNV